MADVARQEQIPPKFLELILRDLRQNGLLESRKGRGGGYRLRRGAEAVSVASVVRMMDGPLAPVPCLSHTAYARCHGCPDEAHCGIRLVLREAHEATLRILENTTLADVAQRTREAKQLANPGRYVI
jgi:Rrf2 family protein